MSLAMPPLHVLEAQALQHLHSVDLTTPMEQLVAVFEALIEVPTKERLSDTAFTRQAAVALEALRDRTRNLVTLVHVLSEHVGRSVSPTPIH
jgi:hypothetical protein